MEYFPGIILFVAVLTMSFQYSNTERIFRELFTNEPCGRDQFRCDNGKCTRYHWRCDKDDDCGDMSEQRNCSIALTAMPFRFESIYRRKQNAEKWLLGQAKNGSAIERWGYYAPRVAVALYLANDTYFYPSNQTSAPMALEIGLQLYSRLAMRDLKDVSSTELASFINAFLVTCIDPRDFEGLDLVAELRNRVNVEEIVNPFVMIALCNAGDNITAEDVIKLEDAFNSARRALWTDVQALSVMALSCVSTKNRSLHIDLRSKVEILKKLQLTSGIIDNYKTTTLVLQALISANDTHDSVNFKASKSISLLFQSQLSNGSFENDILKTYFSLPILNYRSLVNISSAHCNTTKRSEEDTLRDWMLSTAVKHRIKYSLWLGDDRYLERTTQITVPHNIPFYKIMQVAAQLDDTYKFEYTMRSGKPYVYAVAKIEDDPENGKFWFLYLVGDDSKETIIDKSPLDYIPTKDEHLVLWYRKGPWSMN